MLKRLYIFFYSKYEKLPSLAHRSILCLQWLLFAPMLTLIILVFLSGTQHTASAFQLESTFDFQIRTVVKPATIRWGQSFEVVVKVLNQHNRIFTGGVFVSFDQDVLLLMAEGATIHYPGDMLLSLKRRKKVPVKRLHAVKWFARWRAGNDHEIKLLVLPISGQAVRVKVRATIIKPGNSNTLTSFPAAVNAPSLDELGFPTLTSRVDIKYYASPRRAIRKMSDQVAKLGNKEKRYFASALATALNNSKRQSYILKAAPNSAEFEQEIGILRSMAPKVAEKLSADPIDALKQLRCIMINLNCKRGLIYFGMPLEFYAEPSSTESSKTYAKQEFKKYSGAFPFIALLDAHGFSYRYIHSTDTIEIKVYEKKLIFKKSDNLLIDILDMIINSVPPEHAAKRFPEARNKSLKSLRQQLHRK